MHEGLAIGLTSNVTRLTKAVVAIYGYAGAQETACALLVQLELRSGQRLPRSADAKALSDSYALALDRCLQDRRTVLSTAAACSGACRAGAGADVTSYKLAFYYGAAIIDSLSSSGTEPVVVRAARIHRLVALNAILHDDKGMGLPHDVFNELCIAAYGCNEPASVAGLGALRIFELFAAQPVTAASADFLYSPA